MGGEGGRRGNKMKEIRGEGVEAGSEKNRGAARNKRGEKKYEKGEGEMGREIEETGKKKLGETLNDRHSGKSGRRNGRVERRRRRR